MAGAQSENDVLGSSYAIALVEIAEEADELDKVHQDIDALASMLAEDAAVSCRCLSNPARFVPPAQQRAMQSVRCSAWDFATDQRCMLQLAALRGLDSSTLHGD